MSLFKVYLYFDLIKSVLQKGVTATVEITLRTTQNAGRAATMPLEISSENKEMGRVLIRRAGETIAAGEWELC